MDRPVTEATITEAALPDDSAAQVGRHDDVTSADSCGMGKWRTGFCAIDRHQMNTLA